MISAFEELKESRGHLISRLSTDDGAESFLENHTRIIDQYFRRGIQESRAGRSLFNEKRPFALVAVGGYGRMELCRHSDIDILILFGGRIPPRAKELVREILFPLWDLGFDLGYGIRSIKDCIKLSREDYQVLTSMMDARFICGDSPLFFSLTDGLEKKVILKKTVRFNKWLKERDRIRIESFGDSSYLLEPNLKDGIGGLRDYHHMLWLGRAFFHLRTPRDLEYTGKLSHNEYWDLQAQLKFIWLVRNHLHQLSGRKNDRLWFEYQEEIARILKFKRRKDFMAVEQFMGRLHASMAIIKSLHQSFMSNLFPEKQGTGKHIESTDTLTGLHLHHDHIHFDSATSILSNHHLLMEIFEQSARLGYPLSLESTRLVREFLYLVDESFMKSERITNGFLNIIKEEKNFVALDQMFETKFLDAFIPEFRQIRDRVQFDTYHTFPVGRHSLETVRHLKELTNEKDILLPDIFSDIINPESLFLAALFHDIGKSGRDHANKGATITRKILERFNYEETTTEDILFLVRHHLLLAETATRRDLHDEKAVVQCARIVGDMDRLKMLYLLTWADSKATGPGAWNEWIANLVQELFFKILHILERGELASSDVSQKVKQTRSKVRREMMDQINEDDLERLFEVMSLRYILNTHPMVIVHHLKLLLQKPAPFALEAVEDESSGCWEVTLLAKDRPGLFSDIAGVLALNNINILSSDIYTWRDGTALDIFRVTKPLDPILPEETWKQINKDLKKRFTGKLSLSYHLSRKAAPSVLSVPKKPSRPPKVLVDNESSDFFTLIEVFADDCVGLLFLITHTLTSLRLDIKIAKISTKSDQIADVFYVRDLDGQKVEDEEHIKEIKVAILHQLRQ